MAGKATSELNNLLQIIGGTTELLENIWEGTSGSEKYLTMLRSSVARAASITAQFVENAGGVSDRIATVSAPETVEVRRSGTAPGKPHILVVDDEPMGLSLFKQLLTKADFEVTVAGSGFEALDLLVRGGQRFDLAVLDYTMPFMDGEEAFRRMRTIDPTLRVILTTGFIHCQVLEGLLAEGLCGYIRKPHPPAELLSEIQRVLEKSSAVEKSAFN